MNNPVIPVDNDVVFAQGNALIKRQGVIYYRRFLRTHAYILDSLPETRFDSLLAHIILEKIEEQNPPGRYIEQIGTQYSIITRDEAVLRTTITRIWPEKRRLQPRQKSLTLLWHGWNGQWEWNRHANQCWLGMGRLRFKRPRQYIPRTWHLWNLFPRLQIGRRGLYGIGFIWYGYEQYANLSQS